LSEAKKLFLPGVADFLFEFLAFKNFINKFSTNKIFWTKKFE
jgi:hypothetical protein